ncbi:hypothetical protein RB598_009393 [Gaeumannomyces tritici]
MGTWHLSESCAASPASPTEPKRRDYEVVGDRYRFQVLADGLVRYEWAPDGRFEDRPSAFAARRDRAGCSDFSVETTEDGWLEITTSRLRLTYECGCEFSAHGLFALVFGHTRSLWRYGEADDDDANLGGTARTLDGVDGRAGWGTGVASRRGYASVDDSGSMLLTSDGFVAPRMPGPAGAGAGRVDGYLFAYGHDYPAAVAALYLVSGAPPVLPRWALGNWWSRYHAYSAASYSALMGEFEAHGVPLSVAVLDMDWHLTAESDRRVAEAGQTGWTGYTWDRGLFPDPPGFLAGLRARGLRVTLNEHPADGVHSYEERYAEFARAVGRDPASGEPVAFDITSRRYARAYFDVLLRPLGCDFWWVDWQQGRHSRLRGVDPLWVLNHLHTADSARRQKRKQKQKQQRPLILSRYAGPGSHRHPVGFSGDAVASWASLRFQPAFTATAANVGYGWWSHDVGGHMGGGRDDERTARWVQLGCFSPVLRLHSTRSGWVAKEPWRLRGVDGGGGSGGAREAATVFLRLRHRLLPFLHSMNVRASREGVPLVRPLYWEHAERDEAYAYENSYLFGDGLVVMPIAEPADAELGLARTKGWLPPGTWVDFFQGTLYGGDREVWVSRPLALYPVFARAGAIVPMDGAAVPRNGAANPVALEVVIFVGADGAFDLHEEPEEEESEHLVVRGGGGLDSDDDDDEPSPLAQIPEPRLDLITTSIRFSQAEGRVDIQQPPRSPLAPGRRTRTWKLVFPGWRAAGACVVYLQNDRAAAAALRFDMVKDRRGGGLVIHEVPLGAHLVVELDGGREPRFTRASPRDEIRSVLDAAQIEYALKEAVWAALGGDDGDELSRVEMVARLGAVDMSERLRVAVMELLVADEGAGPV